MALLASVSLFAVALLGIAHQYEHDASHIAQECATCTAVRAPRLASPPPASLQPLLLAASDESPLEECVAPIFRATPTARGPPLG